MEARTDAELPQRPPAHIHTACYLVINTRPCIVTSQASRVDHELRRSCRSAAYTATGTMRSCVTPFTMFHYVCPCLLLFCFVFKPHAVIEFSWYTSTSISYQVLFHEYEMHQMDAPGVCTRYGIICTCYIVKLLPGTQVRCAIQVSDRYTKAPL